MEYGVFASSPPPADWRAPAYRRTYSSEQQIFDSSCLRTWTIAPDCFRNTNTDISIVKVKNAPPRRCVPSCVLQRINPDVCPATAPTATSSRSYPERRQFIIGARYYVTSSGLYRRARRERERSTQSTATCWKPAGGILYNDAFYVAPGFRNTVARKLRWRELLHKAAPWGTHAFIHEQMVFHAAAPCLDGSYDGELLHNDKRWRVSHLSSTTMHSLPSTDRRP